MRREILLRALGACELEVHYQPQWSTPTDRIAGVEALLRWPCSGLNPDQFLPLFDAAGLSGELARYTLSSVCSDAVRLSRLSIDFGYLAVNYSYGQLIESRCCDDILATIEACGVRADQLMLEITESERFHHLGNLVDTMDTLGRAGFRFALDDFCTGYSALEHLCHLPVDAMKIDKCFTMSIHEYKAQVLIEQLVEMARRMKITPIAEGVESYQQLKLLSALGCHTLQGHFYAKAMPFNELVAFCKPGETRRSHLRVVR